MAKKKKNISSKELAELVVKGMSEKKGLEVVKLNLSKISNAVCDYFIICHGTSNTHVEAIADSVIEEINKESGIKPTHREGFLKAEWILIDYFDVVVHIFQKANRDFYRLEDLWADAEIERVKDNI
jgi:ribosome-associated protein